MEKESHIELEAGVEGMWESGKEKIRLLLNEVTPGFRADKGTECRVWSRTATRGIFYIIQT